MDECVLKVFNAFRSSLKTRKIDFEVFPELLKDVEMPEDDKSLSRLAFGCCQLILPEVVKAKSVSLTYHWLKFLYETFGEMVSRTNNRQIMNKLLLVHRTLFVSDEFTQKLAFDLWQKVIVVVQRLPGASEWTQTEKVEVLMCPLLNPASLNDSPGSEGLLVARVNCWWILVLAFSQDILILFQKIVEPLLKYTLAGCCICCTKNAKNEPDTLTCITDTSSNWCPLTQFCPPAVFGQGTKFGFRCGIQFYENREPIPVQSGKCSNLGMQFLMAILGLRCSSVFKHPIVTFPMGDATSVILFKCNSVSLLAACHHLLLYYHLKEKFHSDINKLVQKLLLIFVQLDSVLSIPSWVNWSNPPIPEVKSQILTCWLLWLQCGFISTLMLSEALSSFRFCLKLFNSEILWNSKNMSFADSLVMVISERPPSADWQHCVDIIRQITSNKLQDLWIPKILKQTPVEIPDPSKSSQPKTKVETAAVKSKPTHHPPNQKKKKVAETRKGLKASKTAKLKWAKANTKSSRVIKLLHRMTVAEREKVTPAPELKRSKVKEQILWQLKGNTEDLVVKLPTIYVKTKLAFFYEREKYWESKKPAEDPNNDPKNNSEAKLQKYETSALNDDSGSAQIVPDKVSKQEEVTAVPKYFKCFICSQLLKIPVTAACCKKNFCFPCVSEKLSVEKKCPSCGAFLQTVDLFQNAPLLNSIRRWQKHQ